MADFQLFGYPDRLNTLKSKEMKTANLFRVILVIMFFVCNWTALKAKNIVHTVDRGETIEYIASVYGISVDALRAANPGLETFYTGMDITIPIEKTDARLEEQKLSVQNSLYSEAMALMQEGKYKEAVKLYDKILVDGRTPLAVYYNRGKAQYSRGKLNESIVDFNYVVQYDKDNSYPDAENLLAEVKRKKEIKDAERQQMWANIGVALATTAQVAANAYVAHENEKAQRKTSGNNGVSKNYEGMTMAEKLNNPAYLNSEYNRLLNQSIQEVQIQEMQEYQQARIGYQQMTGKDLSLDEFRAQKGAAILALKEEGIDVIGDMNDLNRKNRQEFRAGIAQDRADRLQRIKEENALRYGTSSVSSTPTNTSYGKNELNVTSTSTTNVATAKKTPNIQIEKNRLGGNDAHEQFKSNNLNVNSSDYNYKKRVNLYRADGSKFLLAHSNVELYEKGASTYVKMGSTFFLASTSASNSFDYKISYGATPLYFDK